MFNVQPIFKWAGGKRKLAPLLADIVKEEASECKTYIEPFFGGGAVYFELYNNKLFDEAYINDIIPQLVSFYKTISHNQNIQDIYGGICRLLEEFNTYENKESRKKFFGTVRDEFNSLWVSEQTKEMLQNKVVLEKEEAISSAVLLYVLNRTCFNGLFRVNKKGMFNVPLGSYSKVPTPSLTEMHNFSAALKNTNIFCGDYTALIEKSINTKNSFTYLDPPYVANSKTSNFTSYSKESFKNTDSEDLEHVRLSENFDKLINAGVKAILSNHNNPKVYKIFISGKKNIFVYKINLTKTIGRVDGSKNTSEELLISTFEIKRLKDLRVL